MTESTWHASCLKHRCLVAMVAFTDMHPAYHRVNGSDGCTCAPETLAIHHMNHSPLDALKDAELQVDDILKRVQWAIDGRLDEVLVRLHNIILKHGKRRTRDLRTEEPQKDSAKVAEQQIRDLVDAFDKALDHLQTRECEHGGDYASCQREIEATVESHRTHDSCNEGHEVCKCGHVAGDHEYRHVGDDGRAAWYKPHKCNKCECTEPSICKRQA